MPDRRNERAVAVRVAVAYALAGLGCLYGAAITHRRWEPPYLAAAVLLLVVATGLILRVRAARWIAVATQGALGIAMVTVTYFMLAELSHPGGYNTGLGSLLMKLAWLLLSVPIGVGIMAASTAISLARPAERAELAPGRWDGLVIAGVLTAALLGGRWYLRADYYGGPCRAGDAAACTRFARLAPVRPATADAVADLCVSGDSITGPPACHATGLVRWAARDTVRAAALLEQACLAQPMQFCWSPAHDAKLALPPAIAARLYGIACAAGQRASCEALGTLAERTGGLPAAAGALEQGCGRGVIGACEYLGKATLQLGDTVRALHWMKIACEYNGWACRDVAFVERVRNDPDADRWYDDRCHASPPHGTKQSCQTLGEQFLKRGDSTAARRFLERACIQGLKPACELERPIESRYEVALPGAGPSR